MRLILSAISLFTAKTLAQDSWGSQPEPVSSSALTQPLSTITSEPYVLSTSFPPDSTYASLTEVYGIITTSYYDYNGDWIAHLTFGERSLSSVIRTRTYSKTNTEFTKLSLMTDYHVFTSFIVTRTFLRGNCTTHHQEWYYLGQDTITMICRDEYDYCSMYGSYSPTITQLWSMPSSYGEIKTTTISTRDYPYSYCKLTVDGGALGPIEESSTFEGTRYNTSYSEEPIFKSSSSLGEASNSSDTNSGSFMSGSSYYIETSTSLSSDSSESTLEGLSSSSSSLSDLGSNHEPSSTAVSTSDSSSSASSTDGSGNVGSSMSPILSLLVLFTSLFVFY